MIHPVTAFYAFLCALTLWCAWHSPPWDRLHAMLAAAILTAGCFLSNVAWVTATIGNWVRIDAAVMFALLWVLARTFRRWKLVLASLAVVTMGVHGGFEWLDDRGVTIMYAYPAALNAIFVLQLLTVASNGAKGVWDAGRNWMVSRRPRYPRRHFGMRRGSSDQ